MYFQFSCNKNTQTRTARATPVNRPFLCLQHGERVQCVSGGGCTGVRPWTPSSGVERVDVRHDGLVLRLGQRGRRGRGGATHQTPPSAELVTSLQRALHQHTHPRPVSVKPE